MLSAYFDIHVKQIVPGFQQSTVFQFVDVSFQITMCLSYKQKCYKRLEVFALFQNFAYNMT